ncbi:hypothetical protein ACULNC_05270 [Shigella flexneri]
MRPVATTLLMVAIFTRRDYRLSRPARFGAAGSGLSDHSGGHALPRCQPGCHDLCRYRAARTPVRAMSGLNRCRRKVPAVRQLSLCSSS